MQPMLLAIGKAKNATLQGLLRGWSLRFSPVKEKISIFIF